MSDNNFEQAYEGLDNNNDVYVYENENNVPQNNNNNGKNANTLRKAIERNNANAVTTFINSGQEISVEDLRVAATKASYATNDKKEKAFEILRKLLDKNQNVYLLDEIIHSIAGSTGKYAPDVIGLLVEKGAALNTFGSKTAPPIYDAIVKGSFETFVKCVELGARIDKVVNHPGGWPPIYAAVEQAEVDKVKKVKYLLDKNVSISYVNKIYDNLLITAIRIKEPEIRMEVCKLFLKNKSLKADFQNFAGKTALMMLLDENLIDETNIELLELFLNDQRFINNLDIPDKNNKNIVELVALKSSLSPIPHDQNKENLYDRCIRIIVSKICGRNLLFCKTIAFTFKAEGTSLLRQAILTKNIEFIKLFLQYRVGEVNYSFQDGYSPLTLAIKEKSIPIIEALLQSKAYLDERNSLGIIPLVQAYLTNDQTIINYITTVAYPKYLKRKPTKEEYSEILFGLAKEPSEINYDEFFTSTGIDPTTSPKLEGKTLLMIASEGGNERFVKYLLEKGVDPNEYIDKTVTFPVHVTAYDMAKDMSMRLLLAPYLEQDKPKFRGFLKDDFDLRAVFSNIKEYVICPFCFVPLEHGSGCMYLYTHNCKDDRETWEATGMPVIIHEKLFNTYVDQRNKITVCHHCNRACSSFTTERHGEVELMGHRHIKKVSANPFVKPDGEVYNPRGFFSKENCYAQGGGSHPEKITRFQTLVSFMCFLNANFIGKISNFRAHLLCREMFWDAPLFDYITTVPFSKSIPDTKITGFGTQVDVIEKIMTEKEFIYVCDFPTKLANLGEEATAVNEELPNVPRYARNEIDLAPVETTEIANVRDCFIQTQVNLDDPHGDGRIMWGFKHRQPGSLRIYDHNEKGEFACGPCLEGFIQGYLEANRLICFNDECKGHFHPSELKGKISDELYERYKKRYNKNPPRLQGGGSAKENHNKDYPPLFGPPVQVVQDTCYLPLKGGRKRGPKRTRRGRKQLKKTHKHPKYGKPKRYLRTRKH